MAQYFTPSSVATMMAKMNFSVTQLETFAVREKVLKIGDPAGCGSGALLLAVAQEIYRAEPALLQYASFTGIDLDRTCCRMASLNFLAHMYFTRQSVGEILIMRGNGLGSPNDWYQVLHATHKELSPEAFKPDHTETPHEALAHYPLESEHAHKEESQLDLF